MSALQKLRPKWTLFDLGARVLRLGAFVTFVWCIGVFIAIRMVHAETEQILLGLGDELMKFPGSSELTRELNFNGAQIFMKAEAIDAPMTEVLDHYQHLCRERDGGLGRELRAAMEQYPDIKHQISDSPVLPDFADGVMRIDAGRKGFVSCLDFGDKPGDHESFAKRFSRAVTTGNLTDIGHLRFAYTTRIAGEEDTRTYLVTMWTETPINIHDLIPENGKDVGGADTPGVPRPEFSQRILSSWETGKPYGVNIYRAAQSPAELHAFYTQELPKHGWRFVEMRPNEKVRVDDTYAISVERAEQIVTLLLDPDENDRGFITVLNSDSL